MRAAILGDVRPVARRRRGPDVIAQPGGLLDHRVALVASDEAQLRVVSVIAALCTLRGGEARSFRDREAALGWLRGKSAPFTGPSPSAPHGSLG